MIDAKIEITPKQIESLESIGFIAAGKNHSIAIRTYKRKDKALQMYTWGSGWHGQTGNGSWENIQTPKLLKFSS
jgi:alpha-tubulin suppressor-like RCC1 family protein